MPVPDDYFVEPNKGKKYSPIPADKYQVMVFDVNPIKEMNFQGTEEVDKLEFQFTILEDKKFTEESDEGDKQEFSTRGRRLWRKIPRSFSPGGKFKASLFYELMCAIEGKDLAKEDLVKIQPNTLIGQQLCVFVSINKEWNNIDSFLKKGKDLEPLPTILESQEKEKEENKIGEEVSEEDTKDLPF